METQPNKNDLELHKAFEIIMSIESFSNYINEVIELIYSNTLSKGNLDKILKRNKISRIEDIKEELLDLLIIYINLILNDHIISEDEKRNIGTLKMYFEIKEGDFYKKRYNEVEDILHRQFERLLLDNKIDKEEAIHSVGLQDLFDLSYDQFDDLKNKEVLNALERGADISELDTAKYPKNYKIKDDLDDRTMSQEVKDLVWRRDNGKCTNCGSNEKLEFDHIIPFAKGGSNTYRNIQLLCERCNRKKTNKIG